MRKTFFDIIENMEFDVYQEYKTLLQLFTKENIVLDRYYYTPAEYINENYFRELKLRGTFLSLYDFMNAYELNVASDDLNDLFILCEFLIAILFDENLVYNTSLSEARRITKANINVILEKTNHKLVDISQDDNKKLIIVENNKAATLASEISDDMSVSFDILEYNHYALKGDLGKKKKILASIGLYIEPILKSKVLQNSGYKQLESDAGFVFNNFHIRHNNKEGAKAQDYIVKLTDAELEEWYDKAYDIAIAVIIMSEHLKVETEISELKSKYAWKF